MTGEQRENCPRDAGMLLAALAQTPDLSQEATFVGPLSAQSRRLKPRIRYVRNPSTPAVRGVKTL